MKAVVAYIPVLHEGYRRFLHAHPHPVHLIGPELYEDYRPLAKDIRALSADEVAPALAAWGFEVHVLDRAAAAALAAQNPQLTLHRLKDELAARGVSVSHNAVWQFLRREGLSFKKNAVRS